MQDSPFQVGIIKSFNVICILSCVLSLKLNDTFHVIKTALHFLAQVNMFPSFSRWKWEEWGCGKSPFMGDPQPLEIVFHVALADLSAGGWDGNAVLVTMFLCSMTCRIRICCQGTHWGCGREEKERKQVFPLQTDCSSSSSKRREWWGQRIESTSSWINTGCAGSIASLESRDLWLNCGFSPCRTMLVFIRCSLEMGILNVQ